jgi:hypothetical protein
MLAIGNLPVRLQIFLESGLGEIEAEIWVDWRTWGMLHLTAHNNKTFLVAW